MSGSITWEMVAAMRDRLRAEMRPTLGAVRIIESPHMLERVLYARSPARARRRMRRGFAQHYITRPMRKAFHMPDGTLAMHPDMAAALRAKLRALP